VVEFQTCSPLHLRMFEICVSDDRRLRALKWRIWCLIACMRIAAARTFFCSACGRHKGHAATGAGQMRIFRAQGSGLGGAAPLRFPFHSAAWVAGRQMIGGAMGKVIGGSLAMGCSFRSRPQDRNPPLSGIAPMRTVQGNGTPTPAILLGTQLGQGFWPPGCGGPSRSRGGDAGPLWVTGSLQPLVLLGQSCWGMVLLVSFVSAPLVAYYNFAPFKQVNSGSRWDRTEGSGSAGAASGVRKRPSHLGRGLTESRDYRNRPQAEASRCQPNGIKAAQGSQIKEAARGSRLRPTLLWDDARGEHHTGRRLRYAPRDLEVLRYLSLVR